ncbi:hypothetical protein ACWC5G_30465, partial [Streptomyces sp. NPDC001274]
MAHIGLAVAASHAPGLIGMLDQAPEASQQMVTSAYGALTRQIRDAELDVLLMVANDHMANNRIRAYPDFVVGMAPVHRGPAEFFNPLFCEAPGQRPGTSSFSRVVPTDGAAAWWSS